MVRDFRERCRSFEDLATYHYTFLNVTGNETPERILTGVLSGNLFDVLGVEAELGRTFSTGDGGPGGADVVVLGHALWRARYGGDPAVLGTTLVLDGTPFTVVGVMGDTFNFPFGGVKMWIPLRDDEATERRERGAHILVGRLAPGVSRESARSELDAIQAELGSVHPDVDGRYAGVSVKPMREALNFAYEIMQVSFVVLLGAVISVLLIACVNVASLTLARTSARIREVAVRTALGAGRGRIVRQLLTESLILALAGGALGILLAGWGARALGPLIPEDLYRVGEASVDPGVLFFAFVVTLATPLLFGLGPALSAVRASLTTALKAGGGSGAGIVSMRFRRALVVGEVAMAIVLIAGTGLMVRSFLALQDVELGFRPESILTVEVTLPESGYPVADSRRIYFERAAEAVGTLASVRSVGAVTPLPMNHELWTVQFALEGDAPADTEDWPVAEEFRISPGYLDAMGIRLHAGRAFGSADGPDAPPVALVSRSFAERYWPGRSPVGQILLVGSAETSRRAAVVGVVDDVKHAGFEAEAPVQIYRPIEQAPSTRRFLVVSARGAPETVTAATREALARIDASLPLTVKPMTEIVRENTLQWSLSSLLLGVFGAVALALASLGIYGVISYSVTARRREIGLRMALGATRRDVSGLVVNEGLRLAGLGLAIGLALALVVARLIASLLYGVGPFDPVTFAAVVAVFLATSVLASLVPATRASRTDPTGVLRFE
jgi:predicted permease